jgi:hypothetical protein
MSELISDCSDSKKKSAIFGQYLFLPDFRPMLCKKKVEYANELDIITRIYDDDDDDDACCLIIHGRKLHSLWYQLGVNLWQSSGIILFTAKC